MWARAREGKGFRMAIKKRTVSTIRDGLVITFEGFEGLRLVGSGRVWQLQTLSDGGLWRNYKSCPSLSSAALECFDVATLNGCEGVLSVNQLAIICDDVTRKITDAIAAALSDEEGRAKIDRLTLR